jgi:tetratricopeptide (TPR) repeat protein
VETIARKALEKDPDQRYASAAALSEDIARYLGSQPILARPPSTIYQLRKFARRNRVLVASIVALFVVLAAGVVVSTTQFVWAQASKRQAEASRDEALVEQAKAEAVNQFLQDILGSADPQRAQGREVTVRQALDEAVGRVGSSFAGQPLIEAAVRLTIGRTYREIGAYASAETQLRAAVRLRKEHLGEDHPQVMEALFNLGVLLASMGRHAEAVEDHRIVLESRRARLGPEHPHTLKAAYALGHSLWRAGRFRESEQLHREALEVQRRVLGGEHLDTVWSMHNLGIALRDLGRFEEAERLFREALEISRRIAGVKAPLTLELTTQLGQLLFFQERLDEAEPLLREGLNRRLEVLGENHRSTSESLLALGHLVGRQGDLAQAESLIRRAVAINDRVETANDFWARESLLLVLLEQGKVQEARPLWLSLLDRRREEADGPEADARALIAVASSLLRVPHVEWQDAETALVYAQRAVASPGGEQPVYFHTLAQAYFRTGDRQKAVETEERALTMLGPDDEEARKDLEATLAEFKGSGEGP